MIAGHAIAAGIILMPKNTRELERMPDVMLDEWDN